MKKLCLSIIVLLMLAIVYIWDGYHRQKIVNTKLKNRYYKLKSNFKNERMLKHFTDDLRHINTLHISTEFLEASLYSTASVYFCIIEKGEDEYFLNELNSSSSVCGLWTKETKDKYNIAFQKYNNDLNETAKELNMCTLKGLNIVDSVCQGN